MGKETVDIHRVAMVGSIKYENRRKIKDFVYKIKNKYGDAAIILSSGGGRDPKLVGDGRVGIGAEGYVKKYALEFNMKYEEYPPCHYSWDINCPLKEENYGKRFSLANFIKKNKQIVAKASHIIMFIPRGVEWNQEEDLRKYAKKYERKIIRIE